MRFYFNDNTLRVVIKFANLCVLFVGELMQDKMATQQKHSSHDSTLNTAHVYSNINNSACDRAEDAFTRDQRETIITTAADDEARADARVGLMQLWHASVVSGQLEADYGREQSDPARPLAAGVLGQRTGDDMSFIPLERRPGRITANSEIYDSYSMNHSDLRPIPNSDSLGYQATTPLHNHPSIAPSPSPFDEIATTSRGQKFTYIYQNYLIVCLGALLAGFPPFWVSICVHYCTSFFYNLASRV